MNKSIKLSKILGDIYSENFKGEWDEKYEINWEALRALAGDKTATIHARQPAHNLQPRLER